MHVTAVDLYPMFWALWCATAIAVGYQVLRPFATGEGLLGFPFVAGLLWFYFYVYMAFQVATRLRDVVPQPALCLGQFVALIGYLGLVVGWEAGARRVSSSRIRTDQSQYPADRLWQGGMAFLVIGIVGQSTFTAQETFDPSNTTAYWHMLYLIGYPGAALSIAAILRTPPQKRRSRIIALSIAVAMLQYPFLLGARRGPLFSAVTVLTFAPILLSGRRPRRVVVVGALGGAGFLMLLFLSIRPFIYGTGESALLGWSHALSEISPKEALANRGAELGDNEYAYHCGAVWTLYRTGLYQYGTGYLTLLTHWVPRQLWPDKPGLSEGLLPSAYFEIPNEMGWRMTGGSAWGGAADAFEEFGFLSPLFWAALAFFVGRSYRHALSRSLRDIMAYLGFLAGTHWLVAQGFGAAFVPVCIFIIPPLVLLRCVRVKPSFNQRRSLVASRHGSHTNRALASLHTFGSLSRIPTPVDRNLPAI